MDAITLLKDDHKTVEKLFKKFEKAGDRAFEKKRQTVEDIIAELSKHAAIEEQLFYPVSRATVPDTDDIVLESIEEHHVVKWLLSELDGKDPRDENYDAKVTVLIENVRHHVEEEEQEYFPKVRSELGRKALTELGDAMDAARASAPTHPHPRAPQTPPANLIAGNAAGVADRLADTVSGAAQGGLAALGDVIDRVRGTAKPKAAAKGSKGARQTSASVRSGSKQSVDRAIDAVEGARDTGKKQVAKARRSATATSKAAKAGTKRTATSARKGAKATASSAKSASTSTKKAAKAGAKATAGSARNGAKATSASAKSAGTSTKNAAKSRGTTAKKTAKRSARS
jgi:hemerythrin superfamily protein